MKLTIERSALLGSLTHVQSVVERRNTIPILANVRVDADENDRMRLTATDMDLAIVDGAEASVEQAGATTTPAHTLYDIVRKLPDGAQVSIGMDGESGQISLGSGRSQFRLSCLPIGDFPVMSEGELPHTFAVPKNDLRRLIDKTRFAISTEETRYYLNGIYLHPTAADEGGETRLRAVATDGHRLARVDVPLPDGAAGMPGVIVPRKTVAEVRKLIDEGDEMITIALSESKIRFAIGEATLTSKLIDGSFPDYERVIPQNNENVLTLTNSSFAEAVDRVSTISTEKSRAIKLSIQQDRVTLTATSPDAGTATEELDAEYGAGPLDVGFNARYVLDVAGQIESEFIQFVFGDAASPSLVRDSSDSSALYVIMPMRV
jgi:DNA polymerase-3 subunit beta